MTSSAERSCPEPVLGGNEADRSRAASIAAPDSTRVQELLLDAFEAIPEGIVIFDHEDRLVLWNCRYGQIYQELGVSLKVGKRFEELLREGLARGLYRDAIDREEEWLSERMERHRRPVNEHEHMLASGKWVRIQERRSRGGGSVGVRIDISDLKNRQHELLKQRGQLHDAIENMSQGLLMFDRDGRLIVHNSRYAEIYHIPEGVIQPGMDIVELVKLRERYGTFRGDARKHCEQLFKALAAGHSTTRLIEIPDGRCVQAISRLANDGRFVITHEDITERRRAHDRIQYLAEHDSLTQLANRSRFNSSLECALVEAKESGEQIAILCLDVDRFKEINDVFGHVTGDAYLQTLAARISTVVGASLVARFGGDEFSILIRHADETQARAVAEGVLQVASQEVTIGGHLIKSGISIGIAFFPRDGVDADTLLANADAALYQVKQHGRGSICLFDADMHRKLHEKRTLLQQLLPAITRNEFELHYQPQVRIGSEIVGFEALLRWNHPAQGMLRPDVFVPLAEQTGAIVEIGNWVLRTACETACQWPGDLRVAVNLSAVQFRHGNLVSSVHQALLDTGCPARRLELEITESVLIDDFDRALGILRRLKAIGVSIAMDDFGTGYSSLSYLQSFPFDRIKIDRQFVSGLTVNSQSVPIIRAIIGLANGLGLPVIAEGVETSEQLDILRNEGCQEAQGFLLGRPQAISAYSDAIYGYEAARPRIAIG